MSRAQPILAETPIGQNRLEALLGAGSARVWWRRPVWWAAAAALLAVVAGFLWWQGQRRSDAPHYVTEPVARGDLTVNVAANGTLQPTLAVNVGSELSGTVARVLVDINDRVKKG